jgi:pimeloyl-ACP methyl ester carboxylesterase
VNVSVTGLGTLTNRIGSASSKNPTINRVESISHIQHCNAAKSIDTTSLTSINNKLLHYKRSGEFSGPPIVFVHGLGGSAEFFTPLISSLSLERSHSVHVFDWESHGLSPSSPLSKISIQSLAEDLNGVVSKADTELGVTLVAHSMGCLIAVQFALTHPEKVSKLVLLGPPPSPLPEADSTATHARAETVRMQGMHAVVDAVATAGTSEATKSSNPLAVAAVRMSLLGQDPEGYAKACTALAEAPALDFAALRPRTLIITGSEDKVSPPQLCEKYVEDLQGRASLQVLQNVGHWHVFEDVQGTASAIEGFL